MIKRQVIFSKDFALDWATYSDISMTTCFFLMFHEEDKSCKRLQGMWKRAERYAKELVDISELCFSEIQSHKLYVVFYNWMCCWLIEQEYETQILLLDKMALKVDEYLKDNLLESDVFVQHILYEWKRKCFFDPTRISTRSAEVVSTE